MVKTISSEVGERLAKAKVERDAMQLEHSSGVDCWPALRDARHEFIRAAETLADELVAKGFGADEEIDMKKDWDGEGLPQVGQRVRIVTAEGDQGCADVVAHHMGGLVVWQHTNMDYRRWHADFIRPVLTIEEMSIIQIMKDAELMRVQAERVYQAGYRKELEQ